MESFLSSLKTEQIARKTCLTRDRAKAWVFDQIERFYNPTIRPAATRRWAILSQMDFERHAALA